MCYGKGAIPLRKVERILKENGYVFVRNNGHQIWKRDDGSRIVVPRSCCNYIIKQMFKDNNISVY